MTKEGKYLMAFQVWTRALLPKIMAVSLVWGALVISPHSASAKPTLYLLMLADTADRSIGESTLMDMFNVMKHAQQFADAAGMELYGITGDTGMPVSPVIP